MGWLAAGLGLPGDPPAGGKVVCRTEQGKVLRSIPKSLAEDEAASSDFANWWSGSTGTRRPAGPRSTGS